MNIKEELFRIVDALAAADIAALETEVPPS
jgi:hypothetical protein